MPLHSLLLHFTFQCYVVQSPWTSTGHENLDQFWTVGLTASTSSTESAGKHTRERLQLFNCRVWAFRFSKFTLLKLTVLQSICNLNTVLLRLLPTYLQLFALHLCKSWEPLNWRRLIEIQPTVSFCTFALWYITLFQPIT